MKLFITALCFLLAYQTADGQPFGTETPEEAPADTIRDSEIILDPFLHPELYYDDDVGFQLENGFFISSSGFGLDMFLLQDYSSLYGNFFAGILGRDYGSAWFSGIAAGVDYQLREALSLPDYNRVDVYFRAAPGVGFAGTGNLLGIGGDADFHFGLNAQLLAGVQLNTSARSAFYMQGGTRTLYYPSVSQIGMLTMPMVSAGFRYTISGSPDPPVRYR